MSVETFESRIEGHARFQPISMAEDEQSAGSQFFLDAFKDQHVRVYRHTDREDEARDTCQRQRDADHFEDGKGEKGIEDQRAVGQQTWQAIVQQHEQHDNAQADGGGDLTL